MVMRKNRNSEFLSYYFSFFFMWLIFVIEYKKGTHDFWDYSNNKGAYDTGKCRIQKFVNITWSRIFKTRISRLANGFLFCFYSQYNLLS